MREEVCIIFSVQLVNLPEQFSLLGGKRGHVVVGENSQGHLSLFGWVDVGWWSVLVGLIGIDGLKGHI